MDYKLYLIYIWELQLYKKFFKLSNYIKIIS